MQKAFPALLLIGILVLGSVAPTSFAFAQSDKVNVLIGFDGKPDVSLVNQHGGNVKDNFYPFINVVSAELPSNAIEGLMHNPKISYIENDSTATIHDHPLPETGEYADVWGVVHIEADQVSYDGTEVKVAVIDTGIHSGHSDITVAGGYDFVNNDSTPNDGHGHGTHVSGTLAGIANNAGIIGVAPAVDLYGVKVLSDSGSGSYSNVIKGINWTANNDMDVANLSLGGSTDSQGLCAAVEAAFNAGVLIVASAGNSGNPGGNNDSVGFPAGCDFAIAVAATNQNDSRASFSSTGDAVEISAPGVGIYSSIPNNGYDTWSGTSMAAPHVSGVAALVKNANSSLGPADIRSILQTTAIDLGSHNKYGYGLVNTIGAISEATNGVSNPVVPSPDFTISSNPSSVTTNIGTEISSTITITPSDGMTSVELSAPSATFNPAIVDVSEGSQTSTMTYTVADTPGDYQLTVTGVGDGEVEHTSTISLDVVDPNAVVPSEVKVVDITYHREGGRHNDKHLIISVFLQNDLLDPVSGASVTINLSCDCSKVGWAGTVSSDSNGLAEFQLSNAKSGTYDTTVTSVVAGGLTWVSGNDFHSEPSVKTKSNQNQ